MSKSVAQEPEFSVEKDGGAVRLLLRGAWTIAASRALERAAENLQSAGLKAEDSGAAKVAIDLSGIERLDTAGAWLIDKARARMISADLVGATPEQDILLAAAAYAPPEANKTLAIGPVLRLLAGLGHWTVELGDTVMGGVAFLGELTLGALRVARNPALARPTALVFHLEAFALRAVPVIATINFLVGCIVAQQGIFQLARFGASTYAVNLVGVLVLRELGVLLTSIMVAGRTGSAITAELGSMKMREEVDALRVMGMSPIDVLILPRLLALVIALPLLTFIGDMAALAGGMVTAYLYSGISAAAFLSQLQDAIGMNTYLVGLIKAPFMAVVIGMIASMEGFKVQGSAESLGRRVTDSVVNSIFMVIFVDGLFAIFFASIRY